jgi:hypothetical protein
MMKSLPRTPEDAKKYRYGVRSGRPQGTRYNPKHCAMAIWTPQWPIEMQCSRAAVAGPSSLYCGQHAKMYAKDLS